MGVRLVFESIDANGNETELECKRGNDQEIYLTIHNNGHPPSSIYLDKSTAIKFSKTLRTEISKLEE